MAVVVHIPILTAVIDDNIILRIFALSVMMFSLYSLYLIFAQLSKNKVLIYLGSLIIIISSLWIDSINIAYEMDSCYSSGGRWNYELNSCEGSRVESLNKVYP
ncbi:MAG: hypothetical protein GY793_04160 [Proteobacteria bacterium]|nr:hypothetical protein [Pseudomonadota bacterium]